jgi:hypothetical protein
LVVALLLVCVRPSPPLHVRTIPIVPFDPKATFRITTMGGETLLDDGEIVSYQWSTHTMTLKPGVLKKLDGRWDHHPYGCEFMVVANRVACYRGGMVDPLSMYGYLPEIRPRWDDPERRKPTMRISWVPNTDQRSYEDPRYDHRVAVALASLGLLTE